MDKEMNLREQFEKETGIDALIHHRYDIENLEEAFDEEYVEWLEQRFKEQVEVLEVCNKYITKDWGEESMDEMIECHGECEKLLEEQLKKSGEL